MKLGKFLGAAVAFLCVAGGWADTGDGASEVSVPRAGEACKIAAPSTTLTGTVTWSAKGLPKGMKIAARNNLTDKTFGTLDGGTLYGTPTVPGAYVVKVTAKSGRTSETFDVPVTIGHYVDALLPLQNGYAVNVGMKTLVEFGTNFVGVSVSGLPAGLKFAARETKNNDFGTIAAGSVYGVPTKVSTNCVIFTVAKKELVDGKTKSVTHKASATFAVAAVPAWSVGTFNGRLVSGSGSATMTVAATGKISGKVVAGGKTWSFSASGYDAASASSDADDATAADAGTNRVLTVTAKSGRLTAEVSLNVTADSATGTFVADTVDGTFTDDGIEDTLTLWRNEWKDKGATDKLQDWVGLYTVQLSGGDYGYGYLSLTLDAKGNCRATGKLPDGTAASGTLPLVWNAGNEAPMAIWQLAPSAYKGGYVGGLLELSTNDATSVSRRVTGDGIAWASRAPTATSIYGEGFEETLSADGAYYDKLEALTNYYATTTFNLNSETPTLDTTVRTTDFDENDRRVTTSEWGEEESVIMLDGLSISLDAKGKTFSVDQGKATKPVYDRESETWSYDGANDAALTFSFTKATGIFKGSFTCYYDYVSAMDNTRGTETLTHTSKKVSYEGVMVLGDSMRGFYLWNRTGFYTDEKTDKEKTFTYKESKPVAFER